MLNLEQLKVSRAIRGLIGTSDIACLTAPAGCGKSYTIMNTFDDQNCLFLTPTHASKDVINEGLPSGHSHEVRTVYSAVGWRIWSSGPGYPVNEYLKKISPYVNTEMWNKADIVILDEASMTTKRLFNALLEYCQMYELPLLLCGDANQLPAIHEQVNVFDLGYPVYELSENMRFAGESGIATVANTIRQKIDEKNHKAFRIPDREEWPDVRILNNGDFGKEMKASFDAGEDAIVIAFDHASLGRIRKYLTGEERLFQTGQKIRCLKTEGQFKNGQTFKILFAEKPIIDNHEFKLKDYYSAKPAWVPIEIWKSDNLPLSYQRIHLANGSTFYTIADEFTAKAMKNLLKQLVKLNVHFEFRATRSFDLQFLRTCHACQGSTFDKAFIHKSVLVKSGPYLQQSKAEEWLRLLYVGITRAREELILQAYEV